MPYCYLRYQLVPMHNGWCANAGDIFVGIDITDACNSELEAAVAAAAAEEGLQLTQQQVIHTLPLL